MVVDKWLRRVHASSIWEGGNQDNFKPIYFFFTKRFHTHKKHKKHQTQISDFYSFRVVRAKKCCLCCFLFTHFCFVSLFWACECFCAFLCV